MLIKVIGVLLAIWLAFTVIGFVIHSLFILGVIGLVLLAGTAAYGAIKNRNNPKRLN
ncbi:MAG TPA: hypothetical protein VHW44_15270 [Pseudonocardiaceae bacterium]|jgi:hypothetical protein|nr:hypothetical protein [Pseudonocardiaceae bacterium]